VSAYLIPFQQGISCISEARVYAERPPPNLRAANAVGLIFPLTLADGEPVILQAVPGYPRFTFSMGQRFSLRHVPDDTDRGPWKVRTEAYQYTLHDADGRELWAYHYHPQGLSPITWPHFHMYAATGVREDLAKGHYPTNRVAFEEVLLLLLDLKRGRFGIRPLRADWMRTRAVEPGPAEAQARSRGYQRSASEFTTSATDNRDAFQSRSAIPHLAPCPLAIM
jgi:hypothetical protein